MALPFHRELIPFGKSAPRLSLEGTLGFAEARQRIDDLYGGSLQGDETSVASRWRTYGALVGLGLEFRVTDEVTLAPTLDVGMAHRLEVVGRYDVRWTETIAEDDPAQDFVARAQLVTLHGDLFDVDHYVQIGAGLLVPTADALPIGNGFAIGAAFMLGEDLIGWTVGGRLLF